MIDKARRKQLAFYLRQLSVGNITNDDYEKNIRKHISYGWLPEQYYRAKQAATDDHAFVPILDMSWGLYSDLKKHYLKGGYELNNEQLNVIARCILFLQSDLEYEWPEHKISIARISLVDWLLTIVTLGYRMKQLAKKHRPN